MTDPSNIERIVMQRVHLIRALRWAFSSSVLSTLVSALALWGIGREVWISHVLQNAPRDVFDLPRFYLAAFEHTRLLVQACVLLMTGALLFVAYEVSRAIVLMIRSDF